MNTYRTETRENYRIDWEYDPYAEAPWDSEDGHGEVTGWERRPKAPGEMILCESHVGKRFYDFQGAVKIALRDGWNNCTTKKEAAEAAMEDFKRLRAWCKGDWLYCGVAVIEICKDEKRNVTYAGRSASLWGIESDSSEEYFDEVIKDLIAEIEAEIEGAV